MAIGGIALRTGGTFLRFLQFCCAIAILGIFSYFLAIQTHNQVGVPDWVRAVEGLSGAGALYTLFGILLTCFLGGNSFFAFLAMFLDVLFIGAFIAIAIETRGGDRSCNNLPNYDPLRFYLGDPNNSPAPTPYHACELMKASFALAIIGAVLFLLSIPYQLAITQHHRREKQTNPHVKYGFMGRRSQTAPPNTPGVAAQKRGFWRRNAKVSGNDLENNGYTNGNGAYTNGQEAKYGNNAVNY